MMKSLWKRFHFIRFITVVLTLAAGFSLFAYVTITWPEVTVGALATGIGVGVLLVIWEMT
jgi:hypothetical protein